MKRTTRSGLVWLLVLSLFISVSASAIALVSRINYYTAIVDVNSMIPLVPEDVTLEELQAAAARRAAKAAQPVKTSSLLEDAVRDSRLRFSAATLAHTAPAQAVRLATPVPHPEFTVSDDNTEWSSQTLVELFKSEYTNDQGEVTVASANGDKIIAPGTQNAYTFKLKNTYLVPMDYSVIVRAHLTVSGSIATTVPIVCRLSRYDGTWVAGGENHWVTVEEFDGTEDVATLDTESYVTYTMEWLWPFTGDDAMDTALANLVAQTDVLFSIEIITFATPSFEPGPMPEPEVPKDPEPVKPIIPIHPEPEDPEDLEPVPDEPEKPKPAEPVPEKPVVGEDLPPKTGDESHPVLWISLAAVSLILLLILIFWKDKEKKEEDPEANESEQTEKSGKD